MQKLDCESPDHATAWALQASVACALVLKWLGTCRAITSGIEAAALQAGAGDSAQDLAQLLPS